MGALLFVIFAITATSSAALAWTLCRALAVPAPRRVCAVVAAALLAVVPGTLCRATEHLPAAMVSSAVLFLVATAVIRLRHRTDHVVTPVAMPAWPAWLVGAVLVVFVVHGALTRNFFDEEAHVPFALMIARGFVPPEHPVGPGQVITYHWGIDALYAQLIVAGLRPDRAIDVVTIASMLLFVSAASAFGGAVAGRVGATFGVILMPLAGSLLALPLHEQLGPFQIGRPAIYPKDWTLWTTRPPPLTADFFQHPQGLAFPIVLVVLLLATAGERRLRVFGAFVLCLLSLVQAVHFLVLGFGLLAATCAEAWRSRQFLRAAWVDAASLAAALVGAVLLGGFFAPGAGTSTSLRWGVPFFTDTNPAMSVLHHIVVFGLPFMLLPLPVTAALGGLPWRLRVAVVAGAALAFFLPNVVVYPHSWDIVKLYSAAGFLAAAALTLTFTVLWQRPVERTRTLAWRTGLVLATALTIAFPLVWMSTRTVLQGRLGVPVKNDWRLRDDVLEMGTTLRAVLPRHARVLTNDVEHARMTGVFAPGFDLQKFLNGHMLEYTAAKRLMGYRSAALQDLKPAQLEPLGIDYALLTPRDIAKLTPDGRARLARIPRVDVALPNGIQLYDLRGLGVRERTR